MCMCCVCVRVRVSMRMCACAVLDHGWAAEPSSGPRACDAPVQPQPVAHVLRRGDAAAARAHPEATRQRSRLRAQVILEPLDTFLRRMMRLGMSLPQEEWSMCASRRRGAGRGRWGQPPLACRAQMRGRGTTGRLGSCALYAAARARRVGGGCGARVRCAQAPTLEAGVQQMVLAGGIGRIRPVRARRAVAVAASHARGGRALAERARARLQAGLAGVRA